MKELFEDSDKKRTVERNGFLTMKGQTDTNVYLVESGSVRIFVTDGDAEQIIRFGYPDNLIVLLDSFLTGQPTAYSIQAIKKTVVKVLSRPQFDAWVNSGSNMQQWNQILENLIIQQLEREIDILTASPAERYRRVLSRSPRLFQEIPERHIANYLRMSPETLSRLKKS